MKQDLLNIFAKELFKMEPIEFMGVAHLFGVNLGQVKDSGELDIAEISYQILQKFTALSNTKKKEITKLCKAVNKKGGSTNGNRAKTK